MNRTLDKSNKLDARIKRSNKQIFIWTFAWLVSTASLAFGPKLLWDFNVYLTYIAILCNIVLGIKMLMVNKNLLENMDELQRKIHLNAMANSLGVTMISGTVYGLLEPAGILIETPHPSNLLFVMGLSYLAGVFISTRKYA